MEKPTKVEPGQRYRDTCGRTYTVQATGEAGKFRRQMDDGRGCQFTYSESDIGIHTFLGYAPSPPPASPVPVVCMGQQWRITDPSHDLVDRTFTIDERKSNGNVTLIWDDTGTRAWADEDWVRRSCALVCEPSRRPSTPVQPAPVRCPHMMGAGTKELGIGIQCSRPAEHVGIHEWTSRADQAWSTPVQPTATAAKCDRCGLPATVRNLCAGCNEHLEKKYGGATSAQIEASPADHYEVSVARPAVTAPVARRWEVSQDGKHWVDFDRMTDADPFESYKHRRVDGVCLEMPEPRGYNGKTWAEHVVGEEDIGIQMSFTNAGLPRDRIVEGKPSQAQSLVHDRGCLGIWNTRGR